MRGRLGPTWHRLGAGATRRAPRTVGVFFALVFVVYTCVFPYLAVVNNPNENVRTYMTMAIVEDHTFRIDAIVGRYGWVNDMARAPDKKTKEEHLYSVKAPGTSYLGVPVYWAFGKLAPRFGHKPPKDVRATAEERAWWFRSATWALRVFTVQLPCFAFLVWLERWLRGTTSDAVLRLTAVAAAGLGTNYLAYGLMFASHAPFAITAFGSFAVTTSERLRFPNDARRRRKSRAFLAGLLAGLATLFEYHALPVSVGLALYALLAFWRPTRLLCFAFGGLISAFALMFFQWRAFGNPLTPGHKMSENAAYAALLSKGLFGIGKPSLKVLGTIMANPGFGFFGTSSFMWLGLLAVPFALVSTYGRRIERRQRRTATLAWLLMMAVLFVTVSAAINWRGGWTVGPRYLGAAPPFFAYGATCALEHIAGRSTIRRLIARSLAGGGALASVMQSGLVSLMIGTIPESVTRPLPQLAYPLARAGFVPHHAAELVGWMAPYFWYFAAGCGALAALIAALGPSDDRLAPWLGRWPLVALIAFVAVQPSFLKPDPEREPTDLMAIRFFTANWEPKGRDFITKLREQAERYGTRRPCLWYKLADLERTVGEPQASQDEKRAGAPRSKCR